MFHSDTAVIFIHGILESPNQFEDMKKAISNKYDTEALLLPGHGKTGRDFAASSMKKWQNHVSEKIAQYRKTHENIFIAAHSMGCLIAIREAVKNPEKIRGLFLIAAPLCIRVNPRGIKNGLRVAFNISHKDNEFCRLIKSVYSVSSCKPLDYPLWIPRYRELFSESKKTRRIIPFLNIPSYYVFSQKDEFVSPDSIKYLVKSKNYRLLLLKASGHFYYTVKEREKIINEFVEFIENSFSDCI